MCWLRAISDKERSPRACFSCKYLFPSWLAVSSRASAVSFVELPRVFQSGCRDRVQCAVILALQGKAVVITAVARLHPPSRRSHRYRSAHGRADSWAAPDTVCTPFAGHTRMIRYQGFPDPGPARRSRFPLLFELGRRACIFSQRRIGVGLYLKLVSALGRRRLTGSQTKHVGGPA